MNETGNGRLVKGRGRFLPGILWSLLVAAVLLIASHAQLLPAAPDDWTIDWRTFLFSDRATEQRSDIAVVLVGEESLARYRYRSPVDRGLLAALVRAIDSAGPKAIGLDFILDRPTDPDKDEALLSVVREVASPIVLGGIDRRTRAASESHLKFQEEFLAKAGRPVGHLYFARDEDRLRISDQVVRYLMRPSPIPPERRPFAEILATLDQPMRPLASHHIAWLLPPEAAGTETFATFRVPEHEPGSDAARILPTSWRAALGNRFVLIGGDFVDRDQHLTPLSIADASRLPGILIHAQILAQLRDGRSIYVTPAWAEAAILFAVAGIGFWLGQRFRLKRFDSLVYVVSLCALVALGAFLFAKFRLIIPSTTVFFAWLAGVAGGHYSDWVLRRTQVSQ